MDGSKDHLPGTRWSLYNSGGFLFFGGAAEEGGGRGRCGCVFGWGDGGGWKRNILPACLM